MNWQSSRTDRFKSLFSVFAADLPYSQRVRLVFQLLDTGNRGRFRLKDLQEHAVVFTKELGVEFAGNTFATVDLFRAIDTRDEGSISFYELCMALIMHWEGRTLSGTKKLDYEQVAQGLLNEYSGSMTRHEVLQCIKNRDCPAEFLAAVGPFAINVEHVLKAGQLQETLKLDGLLTVLKESIAQACIELKQEANITVSADDEQNETSQTKQPFASSSAHPKAAPNAKNPGWNLERFRPKRALGPSAQQHPHGQQLPTKGGSVDGLVSARVDHKSSTSKRSGRNASLDLYGEDVVSGVLDDLKQLAPSGSNGTAAASLALTRQEKNVMQLLHEQLTNAIQALTPNAENSLADEGSATTTTSQQLLGMNQMKLSLSEYELARALTHLQAENQRMKTRLHVLDAGGGVSGGGGAYEGGLRIRSDTGLTRETLGLNSPSNSTTATENNSSMLQILAEVKHAFAQQASSRHTLGSLLLSQATLIAPVTESGAHGVPETVSLDGLKACIQEVKSKAHRLHRLKNKQQGIDAANHATEAKLAELEEQLLQSTTELEQANNKLNDYDQLCIQVQVWKEKCYKLNARYIAEITQLAAENEAMTRELSDKTSTVQAMQAHLAAAEALVVAAPSHNHVENHVQAEADAAAAEALRTKLDQVNRQLQSALQEAVANKRVELERDEQIHELHTLVQQLREENERLTADAELANKTIIGEKELRLKAKQLESQLAEARAQLDSMLAAQHEVQQKEQQANALISVNARIEAELEELKLENRTMMEAKVTASRLQQANDTLRGRVKALENFKIQADEFKAKHATATQEIQVLQNQLEETPILMGEVARLKGQVTALLAVINRKNAEIDHSKDESPSVVNDENGTPNNHVASAGAFAAATPRSAASADTIAQQQQQLTKAHKDLQQRDEELRKYADQTQQQQQEIQTLREQLAETKRRNRTTLLKQAFLDHTVPRT